MQTPVSQTLHWSMANRTTKLPHL